jgi:large repetitive protein
MLSAIKEHLTERIVIETGEVVGANLLIGLNFEVVDKQEQVFIVTYDKDGKVLKEARAVEYGMINMNTFTALPAHWRDTTGPWYKEVLNVYNFLENMSRSVKVVPFLITYKGEAKMQRIELQVRRDRKAALPPACLLGVIETTTKEEMERYRYDKKDQASTIKIIESALLGEQLRPLLRPNTRYTVTAEYDYALRYKGDIVKQDTKTQEYVFKTDSAVPKRLDPWVLATTPQNDHKYHFVEDAVQIYFNDGSFEQLFRAYGHTLKAKLRKANGNHPAEDAPKMALNPANLQGIKAAIKTPFLTALSTVAQKLPCVNKSGTSEEHRVFTVPIPLQRNTGYTLEVELTPQPVRLATDTNPLMPLFKIAFTTSRFLNPKELTDTLLTSKITTRVLKAPLADLPPITNDNALQDALLNSGIEALPPAENASISILWAQQGAGFVANALIIDAPEPLWRSRPFPHLETVSHQGGSMQHWVVENKPEFEIVEKGSNSVLKFVHTEGGTRTLVYLKNGVAGQDLTLVWRRHAFSLDPNLYNAPANLIDFDILRIKIPMQAPWEMED